MFGKMMQMGADARAKMATEVTKFRNREFLDAVCAACAMVATADGSADPAEKRKMMGFLERSPELQHFGTKQVLESFQGIISGFEFDVGIGKAEALKTIGKLRKNEEQARMVVRVAIIIGGSDGKFDEQEKDAARAICRDLGLSPTDFDL